MRDCFSASVKVMAIFVVCQSVAAETLKWKDAAGRTHYGNIPSEHGCWPGNDNPAED